MLIDKYIDYVRTVRRYTPRTVEGYRRVLSEFVEAACADASDEALLRAMSPVGIRNYEVHLLEERRLSPRTVNLHLSVLSGLARYLLKEGLLKDNPVHTVRRPKMRKRLPEFYRFESMEQYLADTASAADADNLALLRGDDPLSRELLTRRLERLIVVLLYQTGIRRSELISLNVNAVDAGRGVLHVLGKGDKMREIPLIPSLYQEISLYLRATVLVTGVEKKPEDPLLTTLRGGRLYPVYVDRAVKRQLGGVPSITGRRSPHVLRHTLATELLNDGADLSSIKELLGHSSLAATQVYTHNTVEKLKSVYVNAHPRAKRGGKNGE